MLDPRNKKRILIGLIFSLITLFLILTAYFIFSEGPSCADGKLNQNEKGVDCGGVCAPCQDFSSVQDIAVRSSEFVFGGKDTFDALVKISNPNPSFGSPKFSYRAMLKDSLGNVIDEKNGSGFILPAESKYVAVIGFSVKKEENPSEVVFEISNTEWREFTDYQKPVLSISNKRFDLRSDIVGGESSGLLKNESAFDFDRIKVIVVLRDSGGKLVGVNMTQVSTVRAGEERDFPLLWPYQLPGEVSSVEVEAEANTYDTNNFLRAYGL